MLSLLKWNLIDFPRRYGWVLLCMLGALLLGALSTFVPLGSIPSALFILGAGGLSAVAFPAGCFTALLYAFRWLEEGSSQLELSVPLPAWKMLLGKIAVTLLVNLVSCIFLMQMFIFLAQKTPGSLQLLSLVNLQTALALVLALMLVDCTILFSYIFARSNAVTGSAWMVVCVLMSGAIFGLIVTGSIVAMVLNGALILPVISFTNHLSVDGTLKILSQVVLVWVSVIVIGLEFLGSSALLKYRFRLG